MAGAPVHPVPRHRAARPLARDRRARSVGRDERRPPTRARRSARRHHRRLAVRALDPDQAAPSGDRRGRRVDRARDRRRDVGGRAHLRAYSESPIDVGASATARRPPSSTSTSTACPPTSGTTSSAWLEELDQRRQVGADGLAHLGVGRIANAITGFEEAQRIAGVVAGYPREHPVERRPCGLCTQGIGQLQLSPLPGVSRSISSNTSGVST